MIIKMFQYGLILLAINLFTIINSYTVIGMENVPKDMNLKITLKNENYSSSARLGVLMEGIEFTKSAPYKTLHMDIPVKGKHQSYLYKGPVEFLNFEFTLNKQPRLYDMKHYKQNFPLSTKHVFISFFKVIVPIDTFPLFNIRYIDNESSVESLKLLAAEAVNKYRGHQITDEEIKSQLPLELQDYLKETG